MKYNSKSPNKTHYAETSISISEATDLYIQNARLYGRSKKTIDLYQWVFQVVGFNSADQSIDQYDTLFFRKLLNSLLDKEWKLTSVSIVHRVLNAFLNWSISERLLESNPLDGVPTPKTPKIFPFSLEDNQVAALIKACDKKSKHGYRNYVVLLLFLDCGLRLNELTRLRLTDLALGQRGLRVYGKGAKERIVYLGARTCKAIRRWLDIRGPYKSYSDSLFIDRKGEPLKERWVQQIIARLGERAGIEKRISPHKLRHVSATLAVRNGMDVFTLQRLYGWENIETAMRYVNAAAPALREAHAKASPVDYLCS